MANIYINYLQFILYTIYYININQNHVEHIIIGQNHHVNVDIN
jgi:hypothetical protein